MKIQSNRFIDSKSGKIYFVVHDATVGFDQRFGVEGRLPVEHLVHADAERPPIAFGSVASLPVFHRL